MWGWGLVRCNVTRLCWLQVPLYIASKAVGPLIRFYERRNQRSRALLVAKVSGKPAQTQHKGWGH